MTEDHTDTELLVGTLRLVRVTGPEGWISGAPVLQQLRQQVDGVARWRNIPAIIITEEAYKDAEDPVNRRE